ncbi:MBL fold metallo-hydrolase [Actinosynnema sp. NPDC051121]
MVTSNTRTPCQPPAESSDRSVRGESPRSPESDGVNASVADGSRTGLGVAGARPPAPGVDALRVGQVSAPEYPCPLDRRLIGPVLRLVPRRRPAAIQARNSLQGIARVYDPERDLPGLPGWECVPTPGHTARHAAYFHPQDGVVITGDAVVTVELISLIDLFCRRSWPCAPPRCTTQGRRRAAGSAARLAAREPKLIAPGRGVPLRTSSRELRGSPSTWVDPGADAAAVEVACGSCHGRACGSVWGDGRAHSSPARRVPRDLVPRPS